MTSDVADVSGVTNKVLTHEVGAGAACLKCGDKCPGLDLHFWRKICRNCKCKQEDHAVQDSLATRGIENIGKLLMYDQNADQTTNGIDNHSSPEKKAPPSTLPKTTKDPMNITNSAPVVQQNTQSYNSKPSNEKATVNTQANIQVKQNDPLHVTVDIGGKQTKLDFGHIDQDFPPPPPEDISSPDLPPPPSEEVLEQAATANSSTQVETASPPVPPLPQEFEQKVTVSSPKHEAPPTAEPTKKTTYVTKAASQPLRPKEQSSSKPPSSTSSSENDEASYDWTPVVENEKLIKDFLEALPKEKRPIAGTDGAQYRRKQLMRQLPPHDQEASACHDLTPQEKQEMDVFVTQYRKKALGVGKVDEAEKIKACEGCSQTLKVGDVYVWAERASNEKYWHPNCFACSECKELLVDLIYFYHDEKIYCGRHYCELHKPRCAACDELIFAPEYTQAEDCYWHLKHFCCWQCDQPLGGKNYVPHDNQPVCIPCYEKSFAHRCATCSEVIAPNIEWVTFQDFHWHALPDCFRCTNCSQSLVGKPCIPKDGMVFCSSKCKKEKIPQ